MNGKYVWSLIATVFQKSQTIEGYVPKGSHLHRKCGSRPIKKWCTIDTLLLHTTNRKYHMVCRFVVPSPVTRKVIRQLQDLSNAIQRIFCDISHGFNWHGASRGPSAIAELLVSSIFVEIGILWLFHIFCSDATNACPLFLTRYGIREGWHFLPFWRLRQAHSPPGRHSCWLCLLRQWLFTIISLRLVIRLWHSSGRFAAKTSLLGSSRHFGRRSSCEVQFEHPGTAGFFSGCFILTSWRLASGNANIVMWVEAWRRSNENRSRSAAWLDSSCHINVTVGPWLMRRDGTALFVRRLRVDRPGTTPWMVWSPGLWCLLAFHAPKSHFVLADPMGNGRMVFLWSPGRLESHWLGTFSHCLFVPSARRNGYNVGFWAQSRKLM